LFCAEGVLVAFRFREICFLRIYEGPAAHVLGGSSCFGVFAQLEDYRRQLFELRKYNSYGPFSEF
jgi:hypothetical protein